MRKLLLILSMMVCAHAAFAANAVAPADHKKALEELQVAGKYDTNDGELLYQTHCQSCHMPQGKGVATGAGMYPALANNSNLDAPEYTAFVIMNGLRGMPSFAPVFTNRQVAAVTNYVVTNLGNKSTTTISTDDIQTLRSDPPLEYED